MPRAPSAQAGARADGEGEESHVRAGRSSQSRLWFNEANDSHYFLVPGLIVLVMTLIGALLTAMVMAREWERGTLEALFVTPVRADEILIGKIVPYFVLGMGGLVLCMLAARFLFDVPFRGSFWRAGRRLDALSAGLGRHRPVDFLEAEEPVPRQPGHPARHLHAGADAVGLHLRPAQRAAGDPADQLRACRRAITSALLQTMFLAGDVWSVILPNAAMLASWRRRCWCLTRRATRKSLG